MELDRQKNILVKIGYWVLAAVVLYVGVRYLLPFVMPFLWGFLIAWMLRPVVRFICRHSGMGRRGAAIVSATALYLVLGLLCWLAVSYLVMWGEAFFPRLPELYAQRVAPFINEVGQRLGGFVRRLAGKGATGLEPGKLLMALESALADMVSSASAWSMQVVVEMAKKLPLTMLNILFMLLSSVLICVDYDMVTGFILRQIPPKHKGTVLEMRDFLVSCVWRIIKAYLILMVITFVLLMGGLAVLRVTGFVGISATVAVLDLLPVVGSGLVLIPWGIYALLGGETFRGVGLILVWVLISVVREILEPKIVGDQIGLHPLAALIAMYVGLRFAGFWGLIIAPMVCLLLKYMKDKGIWSCYR